MGDALLAAARAAQANAWCPHSRFPVGAALEAEDGRVFSGCNVENASFGLTICAERGALMAAIAAGARRFRRLVIVANADPAVSPCGACRQVLAEFGGALVVESVGPADTRRWTLRELLPDGFALDRGGTD